MVLPKKALQSHINSASALKGLIADESEDSQGLLTRRAIRAFLDLQVSDMGWEISQSLDPASHVFED